MPRTIRLRPGRLAVVAAALAVAATTVTYGPGLFRHQPRPQAAARTVSLRRTANAAPAPWHGKRSGIIPGDVLIADEQSDRLLLVNPQKQIVWQFPQPGTKTNLPFARPDDAFFTPGYGGIITNEEDRGTVAIVDFATKKVVWEYGKTGVEAAGPGELNFPDDAFFYPKTGTVTVADIRNQRILFIDLKTHRIVKQYGKTGVQVVNPPATYGAWNGDFPAAGGGMLVTQINGRDALLLSAKGRIRYTVRFPGVAYPSDANFTPGGNIIVADYTSPGQVLIVTPAGKVVWRYDVTSGPGMLNQPSLAVQLPNGDVMLNDDANDRVIVIDPRTDKIVWQYGHTGVAGTAPGYLNVPDGFDILPNGAVPGQASWNDPAAPPHV